MPCSAAYYDSRPDPSDPAQRVAFGTSGHRGSAFRGAFNEAHILATTEAICRYRVGAGLRRPAVHRPRHPRPLRAGVADRARGARRATASTSGSTRPTATRRRRPSRTRSSSPTGRRTAGAALADGIVVTPSHNPPDDGGFKYNPPNGGPADTDVTRWIQDEANRILDGVGSRRARRHRAASRTSGRARRRRAYDFLGDVRRRPAERSSTWRPSRASGLRIGVDPLGGASVAYWGAIGERYGLDLTVTNETVDPAFGFMTLDWDGKIRMDPSSPFAMAAPRRRCATGSTSRSATTPTPTATAWSRRAPGCSTRTTCWRRRSRTCSAAVAAVGRRRRRRQDARLVVDHRPGRRRPRPAAGRGPGRVQVVRRRARRRVGRVRRRGERRGVVPAPRRHRLDDRQGRDHRVPAGGELTAPARAATRARCTPG